MLIFLVLCEFACGVFFFATIGQYWPGTNPLPWYGRLIALGLFLWSLSEVILRWPGNH